MFWILSVATIRLSQCSVFMYHDRFIPSIGYHHRDCFLGEIKQDMVSTDLFVYFEPFLRLEYGGQLYWWALPSWDVGCYDHWMTCWDPNIVSGNNSEDLISLYVINMWYNWTKVSSFTRNFFFEKSGSHWWSSKKSRPIRQSASDLAKTWKLCSNFLPPKLMGRRTTPRVSMGSSNSKECFNLRES